MRLNDNILRTARKVAAQRHTTLTALIDAGLRYILSLSSVKSVAARSVKLRTAGRGGLRSGVSIDDNAGLLAKMEQ